jgi:hypothetical protein
MEQLQLDLALVGSGDPWKEVKIQRSLYACGANAGRGDVRFAPDRMRNSDYRPLAHARVLHQDGLYLPCRARLGHSAGRAPMDCRFPA